MSLSEIKDTTGICTDNTIRKYYKDLDEKIDHINKVINKDLLEYGDKTRKSNFDINK